MDDVVRIRSCPKGNSVGSMLAHILIERIKMLSVVDLGSKCVRNTLGHSSLNPRFIFLPPPAVPLLSDNSNGTPDVILLSTGSEVEIVEKAAKVLRDEGKGVRVVSMVCWELFEEQSPEYKASVLPREVTARVSLEAGSTLGWERYVGSNGVVIGIDTFGASAPANILYEEYGITAKAVVEAAKSLLS